MCTHLLCGGNGSVVEGCGAERVAMVSEVFMLWCGVRILYGCVIIFAL